MPQFRNSNGVIPMKAPIRKVLRLFVAVALIALAVPALAVSAPAPVRAIVVFEDGAPGRATVEGIRQLGGSKVRALPLIGGASVVLPSTASLRAAARLSGVAYVEPDVAVHALGKPAGKGGGSQPAEVLPWGVDRVEAESVWASYTGDPIKVAVVDTGVDLGHPDLAANIKGGVSAVAYTSKYTDDNGHGTHVAGTIAAADNSIGVVGVAPQADLYSVKVLDRRGSGYLSDIIAGLQWTVANDIDVANMSLGTAFYSSAFDSAVQQTIASGVVVVAAAGNSGPGAETVGYPAKFPGVIAVAATDANDGVASFSSRGAAVDLAAPGVSVFSTYRGSAYATLSGTSMASPHVAGVAALVLTSPIGGDDINGNGVWDPADVERRLERRAQDLGPAGFDSSYGSGLVRADLAVVP